MNVRVLMKGVLLLVIATVSWGIMFPVGKAVLLSLDAFHLTTIRYGTAAQA